MRVWLTPGGWACDDPIWFMRNYKIMYHLSCCFADSSDEED